LAKADAEKKKWIRYHMKNTDNDYIIFREDEDLFADQKAIQNFFNIAAKTLEGFGVRGGAQAYGSSKKGIEAPQKLTRENMTEKDWS
jgi:hypothetical protein